MSAVKEPVMAGKGNRLRSRSAISALAVGVTTIVYVPSLATDSGEFGRWPVAAQVLWLSLLAVAAPLATHIAVRRSTRSLTKIGALAVALPQLPAMVVLGWVDVWLEVRSGYLLADSGEEAMAYGIGTMASTFIGGVIALFVFVAAATARRHVDVATPGGSVAGAAQ